LYFIYIGLQCKQSVNNIIHPTVYFHIRYLALKFPRQGVRENGTSELIRIEAEYIQKRNLIAAI